MTAELEQVVDAAQRDGQAVGVARVRHVGAGKDHDPFMRHLGLEHLPGGLLTRDQPAGIAASRAASRR